MLKIEGYRSKLIAKLRYSYFQRRANSISITVSEDIRGDGVLRPTSFKSKVKNSVHNRIGEISDREKH